MPLCCSPADCKRVVSSLTAQSLHCAEATIPVHLIANAKRSMRTAALLFPDFLISTRTGHAAQIFGCGFSDRNVLNDIHECSIHECSNYKCNEFDADSFPLNSPLFRLSRYYLSQGVTSFLATTMTLCAEELFAAMRSIDAFCRMREEFIKRTPNKLHHFAGAKCIGINLEGPFLSSSKRGSQAECNLLAPDAALFHQLNAASGGRIKLVTVAPELSRCV